MDFVDMMRGLLRYCWSLWATCRVNSTCWVCNFKWTIRDTCQRTMWDLSNAFSTCRCDFQTYHLHVISALQDNDVREKLHSDYGASYLASMGGIRAKQDLYYSCCSQLMIWLVQLRVWKTCRMPEHNDDLYDYLTVLYGVEIILQLKAKRWMIIESK